MFLISSMRWLKIKKSAENINLDRVGIAFPPKRLKTTTATPEGVNSFKGGLEACSPRNFENFLILGVSQWISGVCNLLCKPLYTSPYQRAIHNKHIVV